MGCVGCDKERGWEGKRKTLYMILLLALGSKYITREVTSASTNKN